MEKTPLVNLTGPTQQRLPPQRTEECFLLTGSQMNLTSRSQKAVPKSPRSTCTWKSRPCSAYPCYNDYMECKSKWKRPMSADNSVSVCRMRKNRSEIFNSNVLGCSLDEGESIVPEPDPNFRHCYTYMSSNLLRSLIRNPWNSDCSDSVSNASDGSRSEKSLGCLLREMAQENSENSFGNAEDCTKSLKNSPGSRENDSEAEKIKSIESALFCCEREVKKVPGSVENFPRRNYRDTSGKAESNELEFQRWSLESSKDVKTEEKIVRFSQERDKGAIPKGLQPLPSRSEVDYNPDQFASPKEKDEDSSASTFVTESEDNGDPKREFENFKDHAVDDICHYQKEPEMESDDKDIGNVRTCSSDCPFSCCKTSSNDSKTNSETEGRHEELEKPDRETTASDSQTDKEENESSKDADSLNEKNLEMAIKDSTYDEIVTIINVLEQEETDSLLTHDVEEVPRVKAEKKDERLHDIYSYLDEVEKSSQETINVAKSHLETVRTATQSILSTVSSVPRLDDLINKNSVELAHEVLSLKLQIEDQSSGIKLLQTTIAEMREAAKVAKNKHEDEIFKITNDAEVAVQRHQKFIKQLLQEKKTLNEKVGKLVEELKAGEDRYQRNLKTIEERHAIEIQRVKEAQAVAEKLKREKWIDTKTQKIKEMTVKGLEPELSRMAARQQQELTELRNLHRSELEAVELRATRRTTELLEELRTELSKDKEETILRETNALRAKLEKQFDEERSKLEHEARKLREERRREKEILESKEAQMQDSYAEMKRCLEREKERERQRIVQELQEQMEALKRRHQNEVKSVRDTLEIEKEAWMNNFKKQQNAKFLEREAELHHQYKRERDRDIELVIERLENEASQAQLELNQASENKIKRMKEKFDQELKEMESTEAILKAKLSDAKAQLLEKDDQIAELNSQIHHLQSDMSHLRKLCEEMSTERTNIKEVIAKEFESQIAQGEKDQEELRNQIAALKTSHIVELAKRDQLAIQAKAEAQQELNQVYNRVKMTVNKKEEALEVLREQHKSVLERCSHLEKMLENQRRNLLLK